VKSFLLRAAALGLAFGGPAALAQTAAEPSAPAETPAAEVALGTPLAEVNGETLTLGALVALRRELPEQYQGLADEVLLEGLTEQMIDHMLLAQAAVKAGLGERPAVALNLANQRRAILADAYLQTQVAARITPEAVEALFAERYANAPVEQEVHAAHILVDSEEKAAELKAQIDAGADFAALAAEHGTDGTASRGGDLGWFAHGDMVPEFADAVFAMEPGTVSAPVKTAFGWHLIKLEERRDRQPPALAEVREGLMGEMVQKEQLAVMAELRAGATVVKADPKVPPEAVRADSLLDADN
jgi:peptidyl-prolyl cis-trans isomerase C